MATPVAPPSPQQVEAEPLNATAIAIHWKKPAFTTPVTSYSVRYSAVIVKDGIEDSAESQVKVVNGYVQQLGPVCIFSLGRTSEMSIAMGSG